MKKGIIVGCLLVVCAVAGWFVLSYEWPTSPTDRDLLYAARGIPAFQELEREHGPLTVKNPSSGIIFSSSSGHIGQGLIVGINDGILNWTYHPDTRETIIREISVGGESVYQLDEWR